MWANRCSFLMIRKDLAQWYQTTGTSKRTCGKSICQYILNLGTSEVACNYKTQLTGLQYNGLGKG